jgi:hypothetical protein
MSVGTKIGVLGIAALVVAVAVTRYDYRNEGGGDRYKPPPAARELAFRVTVRRYLVIGKYDDPRSPIIHWTIDATGGTEAQKKSEWSRNVGKYPAGTYYSLYVQPGMNPPAVVTQEVTVLWGGVVLCGPKKQSGAEIPRCAGYTA